MFKWQLEKPLIIFDVEATGVNPRADRIIELSAVKLYPDQSRETHTVRINPGIPIPPETTNIHGITDADVADAKPFRDQAPRLFQLFDGCDLGGYNCIRFDVPMLIEEFLRASINFSLDGRRIIDAQRIYHKREPRDLTAALAFYCKTQLLNAHGAEADALATLQVFEGQFQRYPDLPRDIVTLHKYCDLRDPSWADRDGKLRWVGGAITVNFGKKKGESLVDLAVKDPGFLRWMLKGDFASDTKDFVTKALNNQAPKSPVGAGLRDQLQNLPLNL